MDRTLSLLGIAPAEIAEKTAAAMRGAAGPAITLHRAGDVVLLAEAAETARKKLFATRGRKGLMLSLHRLQRRLELGCLAGPFLPFDPAAAVCAAADLPRLLVASADALAEALRRDGHSHQWDIIIRWQPEAVLAARREDFAAITDRAALAAAIGATLRDERLRRLAALRAALALRVTALAADAPAEGDGETGATVLVPLGGEALIEAALGALPADVTSGASADLRGPLPPISFTPLRVTALEAAAVEQAWRALDLPERLDRADLTRRWRDIAVRLHPDKAGPEADPARLDEAGRAYKLLRGLARTLPDGPLELAALRAQSGPHFSIPAEAA